MIVFCHLLNDRSGSPAVLRATLDALDARKNGVLYVGSQGQGVLDEAGVLTRRYWYYRSRHRIVTLFTYFVSQIALYRSLSRASDIPSDAIIFVNTLLPFGAMIWGKRSGRRVVVHVHEVSITPAPLRLFLINCAKRCADQLLFVSADQYHRLPIVGPSAVILPNPVSPALSARADVPRAERRSPFRVLMLASLRGYKGIAEFMSLAMSLHYRKDIVFDLVLNADQDEVQAFVARHAFASNVTIFPRTDDPASFYERAAVVVNLSRVDQWIETFGLTIVEAMTFGLPVIAPPVGGPVEIVTHGVEGYCIDSREMKSLRQAITTLVDDSESYEAMARAARKRAQEFTFDAYTRALRSVIGAANANSRSAP